jgi:cytidylate kinase
MQRPNRITIDGPAGSGKSTVGEQLAHLLGYLYIDTGAMYRALTWLAIQLGVDIHNGPVLAQLARDAEIVISHPHINDGRQYTVKVRGQDVTWDIRNAAVTQAVSTASAHPEVRAVVIAQQRAMAQQPGIVMVGRDIGSIVLPDAELKIYLTASPEERARRRYAELMERAGQHNPMPPSLQAVLQDIQRRDELDHDRMQPAADAIIIPTDNLSVQQVIDLIYSRLEDHP